jgi:HAE1 family hydrophobic/amphiphilic exporter-1
MQGGAASDSLDVVVSAEDPAVVARAAEEVRAELESRIDLANVTSDLVAAAPEIQIRVDPGSAVAAGLTAAQIGGEIRTVLTPQVIGRIQLGDAEPVALVVGVEHSRIESVDSLRRLPVGIARVPLGSIADVRQTDVQGRITRIDESPSATISAELVGDDTGATSAAVSQALDRLRSEGAIPPSARVELGGVSAQQSEAFGGLFASMGVAILLVYLMMVLAFNSLITPFIILFTLPLATIGAFPALLLTDRPIGLSALIGFLMLIGIVVTNAIVLLDLVERLRAAGHPTDEALIEGGRTRIRPILMTAIATILALVPLAAGFNEGSIIAAELGTVVIGGLLSSTFLTLLVVPAVYSLVAGLKARISRPAPSPAPVEVGSDPATWASQTGR